MVAAWMTRMLSFAALASLATLPTFALDTQLDGINYDLRQGADGDANKCKSADTIGAELKLLTSVTKNIRTYSLSDCDILPVIKHAKTLGLTVWLGIWVGKEDKVFQKECAVMQQLIDAKLIDDNIVGFNVGSEAVYRKDVTPDQAIASLKSFKELLAKNSINKPAAITDIIDTMTANPQMLAAGDVVTINQFPFWEKVEASEAAAQFLTRFKPLLTAVGDKQVIITETGWPTGGKNENASVASPAASARYLNDFLLLAKDQKWKYYYFQAFDSPYKATAPGEQDTVEASFGLFSTDGKMKPAFADLKVAKMTNDKEANAGQGSGKGGNGGGNGGGTSGNVGVPSIGGGNNGHAAGSTPGHNGTTGNGGKGNVSSTTTTTGGNGAVHGTTTGSNVDTSNIARDNSTSAANKKDSGTGRVGNSILALVAGVVAMALTQ